MISSLDITRILAESSRYLVDAEATSLEYYRKERAIQLYIKGDRRHCLTFSYHPRHHGLYFLPAGRSRLDTLEKYRPFAKEVIGGKVISISQIPNDRIIQIGINNGGTIRYLIYEVLGPNGNLWFLDSDRRILASLRDRSFVEKTPYEAPALPDMLDPALITPDDLKALFASVPESNPARLLEKNLYGIDYELGKTVMGAEEWPRVVTDPDSLIFMVRKLKDIIEAYHQPDRPIYGYIIKGKIHCYPVRIINRTEIGKFKSLSLAQRELLSMAREEGDVEDHREDTIKAVSAKIKKLNRLIKKLDGDIEEASQYEKYLHIADLLKIHLARLGRGMTSITVPNLYDDGNDIEIPLDPKFTGQENIESYTRRYRKGKEGLELLTRRRENSLQELSSLEEALTAFETNFERAENHFPELLPRSREASGSGRTVSLPYREYQTSTGVTIFVGKTGENNDRTTFEYAKPYELWFHTSQCPGSHVVMKFPHKSFVPSKLEIEETAAVAAWHSKARGSVKVPVSYTQRKYVRKPRKAKPGLVTIEREKTIIVEPRDLEKKAK